MVYRASLCSIINQLLLHKRSKNYVSVYVTKCLMMLQVYTYRECITKYQLVDFSAAPSVLNQTSEGKFEAHFFIFCWSEGGGGFQNSFSKPAVWKILMTVLL